MRIGNDDTPRHAWDAEATLWAQLTGKSITESYDETLFRYLWAGDPRPVSDRLIKGHELGPITSKALGLMLGDAFGLEIKGADGTRHQIPIRFFAKRRPGKRGKLRNPENFFREMLLADAVAEKIKEFGPGCYDAAIKTILGECLKTGGTYKEQTIRDAYDKHYGKTARYGKK